MTASSSADVFCHVALPRPVFQTFRYRIPPRFAERAVPGARVRVPFGRGREIGIIHSIAETPPGRSVKDIAEVLDDEPVLSLALLHLCRWTSDYYAAPPGLVYRTALPPGLLGETQPSGTAELKRQVLELVGEAPTLLERDAAFGRARKQRQAFETLEAIGGSASVAHLESHYGYSRAVLGGLVDRGLAEITLESVTRDPFAGTGDDVELPRHLNPQQTAVLAALTGLSEKAAPGSPC